MDWSLFTKITSLALVDAVNVCALAVLTAILINILAGNVNKPRQVLKAGLSFVLAVFITYLFYAYILVQFFTTLTETFRGISPYLYKGFAVLAMIVGALNIKDFFRYRRGAAITEIPLSARPKLHRLLQKIKTPSGAFLLGILVTLFLLTCTIWPLIVATGLLAEQGFIGALPWFIYYNFLFIIPMLLITFAVYLGSTTLTRVEYWKKKNTKLLHLIAGILLFGVGLGLIMGWL